jgi:hypothetical protein
MVSTAYINEAIALLLFELRYTPKLDTHREKENND